MNGQRRGLWARWPWQRCNARLLHQAGLVYWGRCDRYKNHPAPHLLERGMDIVEFTTVS